MGHDRVGKPIDRGLQDELVVWIPQLWAQPAMERNLDGAHHEIVEEV